jgi:two-component system chemotaxis response regulator CheY
MDDGVPRPARVLVVDDDRSMRLLCTTNLELEGFAVLEAGDGRSGFARACTDRPDLILTDVSMPELDGFGLAEALGRDARTSSIPVIFLSGDTSSGNRVRANELGAHAYLTKPLDPTTLAATIAAALQSVREPCPTT